MKISSLLKKTYDGYNWMMKHHPKAAKKSRVRKKWKKRHGAGLIESLAATDSLFSSFLKNASEQYDGGYIEVPLFGKRFYE